MRDFDKDIEAYRYEDTHKIRNEEWVLIFICVKNNRVVCNILGVNNTLNISLIKADYKSGTLKDLYNNLPEVVFNDRYGITARL